MTSIELQIHFASKVTHLLGKYDQTRESEKPVIDSRVSFVLFFSIITCFFPVFFPINLKPLSPVFLISHPFSPITGSYFYHCDVIMQVQNCFIEGESQFKYIFCKKKCE